MNLETASAIITGGASGLGYATAQALARECAGLVIVDLPDNDDEHPRAAAAAELGDHVSFLPGDVRDPQLAQRAAEAAQAAGPLRVVVNCAGIATPGKLVGRSGPLDYETFMQVLSINTGGTMNMMAAAAAVMKGNDPADGDRGVIINTASVAAYEGQIGQIAYAASKGAVASMTLPAARELARDGIRVATIAPGLFETPMMAGLPDAARESLQQKTLHPPRLGRPEDYALTARQIIANPMLNGEVIRLDGAIRLDPK